MLNEDCLSHPFPMNFDDESLLERALVQQCVDDNIRDNIYDAKMDESVQAI